MQIVNKYTICLAFTDGETINIKVLKGFNTQVKCFFICVLFKQDIMKHAKLIWNSYLLTFSTFLAIIGTDGYSRSDS